MVLGNIHILGANLVVGEVNVYLHLEFQVGHYLQVEGVVVEGVLVLVDDLEGEIHPQRHP